jgi:hypothetical protein
VLEQTEKGEKMSKAMTQTTSGHNLRVMMAIAALAAVLLVLTLVAVLKDHSANFALTEFSEVDYCVRHNA